MKIYNYNKVTKEFTYSENALLDAVTSQREKKNVYFIPANSTTVEVPKVSKGKVAVFNEELNKWEQVEDNRGTIVFNIETRQPLVWTQLGPITKEYVKELKPSLTELKVKFLSKLKENFLNLINNEKVEIPELKLSFYYRSLENIRKEQGLGLAVSRDDNNKVYMGLTDEQYNAIIRFLTIYGQLAYLNKWQVETLINNCNDVELLKTHEGKLDIKVDIKRVQNLMKMDDDKVKDYFIRNARNIK